MSSRLFIGNLPKNSSEESLRSLFGRYGPISDVYLPLDYYDRRPRSFGYIEFVDAQDAENAMEKLDRSLFYGNALDIQISVGDRKTPNEMRTKEWSPLRHGPRHDDRRRGRSRSGSPRRRRCRSSSNRSMSRSPSHSRGRRRRSPSLHRTRSRTGSGSRSGTRSRSHVKKDGSPRPGDSGHESTKE